MTRTAGCEVRQPIGRRRHEFGGLILNRIEYAEREGAQAQREPERLIVSPCTI